MSKGGYKIFDQGSMYFVSFAVVHWVDVFTRKEYRDLIVDSLKYCQDKKGLVIYAWCIMSNHVHLIISANDNNISDVLDDFKKFTSKKIIAAIESNPVESRKEWMLEIFKQAAQNSRNRNYQFWQQTDTDYSLSYFLLLLFTHFTLNPASFTSSLLLPINTLKSPGS